MTVSTLSPLELDPASGVTRTPPRPPHLREPDYDEHFDHTTVLYDAFRSVNDRWVVCIGPPLANLENHVLPALKSIFGVDAKRDIRVRSLYHHVQIWIRSAGAVADPEPGLFSQRQLGVQANGQNLFNGKRVLVTMSRNNRLTWIRDWARFHAANHGCDAILFYDNASDAYSLTEVEDALTSVPGIETAVVIDWPFKYGPVGHAWDSDFSQYASLEHARYRFLAGARAVMNIDIDELVTTDDGSSIFDLVEQSETGYLQFQGYSVENATEWRGDPALRRHKHFFMVKQPPAPALRKWIVAPSRCSMRSRWVVHHVTGMQPDVLRSGIARYGHFEAITDNWRFERYRREPVDPAVHSPDSDLLRWMNVFDEDGVEPCARPLTKTA
jgi:hypothetical protein